MRCGRRKSKRKRHPPPPERRVVHFAHRRAVIGVDHAIGRRQNRRVLRRQMRRQRNRSTSPGAACSGAISIRCRRAAAGQLLFAARFRPVGRISGRRFRLGAADRAPDAAQKPKAIAADALARRLVAVGVPIQLRASATIRFRVAVDMAALRERTANIGVLYPRTPMFRLIKTRALEPKTRKFANWLRKTADELKRRSSAGELGAARLAVRGFRPCSAASRR
jgi:hypothetical protein